MQMQHHSVENTLNKCEIYTKWVIIFNTFCLLLLIVEKYIINININLILVILRTIIFVEKLIDLLLNKNKQV